MFLHYSTIKDIEVWGSSYDQQTEIEITDEDGNAHITSLGTICAIFLSQKKQFDEIIKKELKGAE